MTTTRRFAVILWTAFAVSVLPLRFCSVTACAAAADDSNKIVPSEALIIGAVGMRSRSAINPDPIDQIIVASGHYRPTEGEKVATVNGIARAWEKLQLGDDGWFQHPYLAGGYAFIPVHSESDRVVMMIAGGHVTVNVNGEPHVGDPYSTGYVHLPIQLKRGENDLLFRVGRGKLAVKLVPPDAPLMLMPQDTTLPDIRPDSAEAMLGAIPLVNATTETITDAFITAVIEGGRPVRTPVGPIPPLSQRKSPFRFTVPSDYADRSKEERIIQLSVSRGNGKPIHTAETKLRAVNADQPYRVTFISEIDGSIQYYAVTPQQLPASPSETLPAMVLSLHGASVEAISQARAYAPKSWAVIVAPTNRRPFGFDWEDWGRRDAIEVLNLAQRTIPYDPQRVYLTGHSMGGHGTWHVGVNFPDRFAAIGPSAGWISFWSYAGATRPASADHVESILMRSTTCSDTLGLSRNYLSQGIYILHGDADDNVPPEQARTMRDHLAGYHHDFQYFEQPGAGHWWESSNEPGAECVDWPPMFDLFARRRLPPAEEVRKVDFTTGNPGVSASCNWLTISAQRQQSAPAHVAITVDPHKRRFIGETSNAAALSIRLDAIIGAGAVSVELDGKALDNLPGKPDSNELHFERGTDGWQWVRESSYPGGKSPDRYGPFKSVFDRNVLLVYGTGGTDEENALLLSRARFDSETFWYRGNGAFDIIPDTEFNSDATLDRNVILYGNSDTNRAWKALMPDCPIELTRTRIRVADRILEDDGVACLFIRPRPGSSKALVGVIGGTGAAGMRLSASVPYFVSGVGIPDLLVIHSSALEKGTDGVVADGFFGLDWSVETGEIAWRDRFGKRCRKSVEEANQDGPVLP